MIEARLRELWKPVKGYEGTYEVSNIGRVRRLTTGYGKPITPKIVKGSLNDGYPKVALCLRNKCRQVFVHRLVLEAFVGPCPEGLECAHLDGNRNNPRLENLKWCTRKENHSHKALHGTKQQGENGTPHKLTLKQVNEIRSRYERRAYRISNTMELAKEYGVHQTTISKIVRGALWNFSPEVKP